ncbi:MAG TPA: hypothetical protein DD381_12635 [Lentisphaeria bacterium]|nr:MAG: hypothetical protein A2X47_12205 [Lentisphaerae bacterium GWF2_38_69]HBM17171.1 hypothetical protein [Lentisphaeria bacterium]
MIKAILLGIYSEDILPLLHKYDIDVIRDNRCPDVVITYGGDGTLLAAEREFPGIPKLPIRDIRTAPLCPRHFVEEIIRRYLEGILEMSSMIKISAKCNDKEFIALNDIFIHNCQRVTAIRYSVIIDDELYIREAASDSFGVATPHGSTAYFRSITGTAFRSGLGMAFSNSREREAHLIIPDSSSIKVKILRGPAIMVADNCKDIITLDEGDDITISKYSKSAVAYGLKEFMCHDCRNLRHKVTYQYA